MKFKTVLSIYQRTHTYFKEAEHRIVKPVSSRLNIYFSYILLNYRPYLLQDGSDGDEDEEYDDYYDDEEEEDYDPEEEEEEEEGIRPEPYPKQGRVNIEEEEEEEAKEEEEEERNNPYYYSHRARPSSPLANIPPQRRPRPPPRPYSHISPPSHTLEAPSRLFTPPSPPQLPPTPPTETTTLGTVDAATPHYYFNLTNYARVFLAKGQPLGLSRVPRSPEE